MPDARSPFGGRREAARPTGVGLRDEPDHGSQGSSRGPIRPDLPACAAAGPPNHGVRFWRSCESQRFFVGFSCFRGCLLLGGPLVS
jgi:hypothetical protein